MHLYRNQYGHVLHLSLMQRLREIWANLNTLSKAKTLSSNAWNYSQKSDTTQNPITPKVRVNGTRFIVRALRRRKKLWCFKTPLINFNFQQWSRSYFLLHHQWISKQTGKEKIKQTVSWRILTWYATKISSFVGLLGFSQLTAKRV